MGETWWLEKLGLWEPTVQPVHILVDRESGQLRLGAEAGITLKGQPLSCLSPSPSVSTASQNSDPNSETRVQTQGLVAKISQSNQLWSGLGVSLCLRCSFFRGSYPCHTWCQEASFSPLDYKNFKFRRIGKFLKVTLFPVMVWATF